MNEKGKLTETENVIIYVSYRIRNSYGTLMDKRKYFWNRIRRYGYGWTPASEMTYIVSGGALISTHSLRINGNVMLETRHKWSIIIIFFPEGGLKKLVKMKRLGMSKIPCGHKRAYCRVEEQR